MLTTSQTRVVAYAGEGGIYHPKCDAEYVEADDAFGRAWDRWNRTREPGQHWGEPHWSEFVRDEYPGLDQRGVIAFTLDDWRSGNAADEVDQYLAEFDKDPLAVLARFDEGDLVADLLDEGVLRLPPVVGDHLPGIDPGPPPRWILTVHPDDVLWPDEGDETLRQRVECYLDQIVEGQVFCDGCGEAIE